PRPRPPLSPGPGNARRRADRHGGGEERLRRGIAARADAPRGPGADRRDRLADAVAGRVAGAVGGRLAARLLPVSQPGVSELLLPLRLPDVVGFGRLARQRFSRRTNPHILITVSRVIHPILTTRNLWW